MKVKFRDVYMFKVKLCLIYLFMTQTSYGQVVDVISELKPDGKNKQILFTNRSAASSITNKYDPESLPVNGCLLNYGPANSLEILKAANEASPNVMSYYFKEGYSVANWLNEFDFCNKADTVTDNKSYLIRKANNSTSLEELAQQIKLESNSINLELNSFKHYEKLYGKTLFRSGEYKDWPELFLQKQFADKRINIGYSREYIFELDNTLQALVSQKTNSTFNGSIPKGSQKSYDNNKHALQYRIVFSLQWLDYSVCPNGKNTSNNSYCSANFGRYLHFLINFIDDRYEYMPSDSYQFDEPTGMTIYNASLQQLLKQTYPEKNWEKNPFKILNQKISVRFNLLPLMRDAILSALKQKYLPAKLNLENSNQLESDDSYLKHYFINSFNLGYESPGLARVVNKIEKFKLSSRNDVVGYIDLVDSITGKVSGWVCLNGYSDHTQFHVYAGNSAFSGGEYVGNGIANVSPEEGLSKACNDPQKKAHRFIFTPQDLASVSDKAIYIHGINNFDNSVIQNSGKLRFPKYKEINGYIDSVKSDGTVSGWACIKGTSESIKIHVYAGGGYPQGKFLGEIVANVKSEEGVGKACLDSTNSPHRFQFKIADTANIKGQKIYIHGINNFDNALIRKSGELSFP